MNVGDKVQVVGYPFDGPIGNAIKGDQERVTGTIERIDDGVTYPIVVRVDDKRILLPCKTDEVQPAD